MQQSNNSATEGGGSLQYLRSMIPIVPSMPTVNWSQPPPTIQDVKPRSIWDRITGAIVCPTSSLPEIDEQALYSSKEDEFDIEVGRMLDKIEEEENDRAVIESLTQDEREFMDYMCETDGTDITAIGENECDFDIECV